MSVATLHGYVSSAASRDPDALAVAGPDGALSYGELDRLAGVQASALRERGVRPGDRVLLWTGKSVAGVAAMQATLRLGACYVPVTGSNPPARVERIARDCAARVVLAEADLAARVPAAGIGAPVVPLAALTGGDAAAVEPYPSAPDDPAYILYTSGSTGAPKGVCLSHRNALAFVDWAGELLGVGPRDRLSNHAPFNFDLSVFDLYAAFRAGASVHLVPAELSYAPAQLVRFLHEREISIWYSVPSAVTLMIRDGGLLDGPCPRRLRVCVVAGEPMAIRYAQALRKAWSGLRLFNWYGPTETNVCTSYEMSDADLARQDPLPIGRAACGDTVTLDPDAGTGPGAEEGEVVVTGPTVMLGYWGRPPHRGPYRTGDLARRTPDGDLEYVARRDNLVKLRGHRVELGEIEAALTGHPAVADAAALVTGSGLDAALHAAVVLEAGAPRPGLLELKRWCAQRLPTYMIIDAVHYLDQLPLTPNGKTDRPALRAATEGGRS